MRPRVFASLGLVLLAAAPLAAQDFEALLATPVPEVGNSDRSPEQYGGGANTTLVPIQSFVPIVGGAPYASQVHGYYGATTQTDVTFWAPLEVAVGVQVERVCLETFDNDDLEAITFLLVGGEAGSAGNPTPAGAPLAGASTGVATVPGYALLCAAPIGSFTFPLSVRTRGNLNGTGTDTTVQYYILVGAPAPRTANAVTFGAAVITWRRVVPAGPATATFNDVPTTHIFYRWIETLAASGITGGCGGGGYCPDAPITRGQMAVFIAQSLGLYFPN
jgi:S-layer family protein